MQLHIYPPKVAVFFGIFTPTIIFHYVPSDKVIKLFLNLGNDTFSFTKPAPKNLNQNNVKN